MRQIRPENGRARSVRTGWRRKALKASLILRLLMRLLPAHDRHLIRTAVGVRRETAALATIQITRIISLSRAPDLRLPSSVPPPPSPDAVASIDSIRSMCVCTSSHLLTTSVVGFEHTHARTYLRTSQNTCGRSRRLP